MFVRIDCPKAQTSYVPRKVLQNLSVKRGVFHAIRHPFNEKFHTVPCPWNGPAL
jgi:hypothetical protein